MGFYMYLSKIEVTNFRNYQSENENNVSELEKAIKKIPEFEPVEYQSDNSKMLSIIENFIDAFGAGAKKH